MANDKVAEFKKELKELLAKYNASIDWDCGDGSDTYGIYGETMSIDVDGKTEKICDGWSIESADL
jgi:hypothetical protein